jgi:hypothetical protein
MDEEEGAVESKQDLLVDADLALEHYALGALIIIVRSAILSEERRRNDSDESQQPDEEVKGHKEPRMHALAMSGTASREEFDERYQNRKASLCRSVLVQQPNGRGRDYVNIPQRRIGRIRSPLERNSEHMEIRENQG